MPKLRIGAKATAFLNSQHSMRKHTKENYELALKDFNFFAYPKVFEECYLDADEVHAILTELEQVIEASSWNLFLANYQRLAKWLSDPEDEICPRVWRKIDFKKIDWDKKLKDEFLKEEEFDVVLKTVLNTMHRAIYGVAVAGLRAGEILGLCLKDVEPFPPGYKITVSGKTGTRPVYISRFAPLLTAWLNVHPLRGDKNAPLWVVYDCMDGRYRALEYMGLYRVITKYGRRAKVGKHVHPHLLRHTRVTWTAQNTKIRVGNSLANEMFGWSKKSNRYSHYSHIQGSDVADASIALDGMKVAVRKAEEEPRLQPKQCFRCGELNDPVALYCVKCGLVMDEAEAARILQRQQAIEGKMEMLDNIYKALQENPDLMRKLAKRKLDKT